MVFEGAHERFDYVANVEHAHGRTADGVYGRVEYAVHDRVDDTGQGGVQYVAGTL